MDKQQKQKILVICPGRGTYNKDELGYLARHHADKQPLLDGIDSYRRDQSQVGVQELDGRDRYSIIEHTKGENASALIYGCAMGDFQSIDRDKYEVVAVTGNSMGWYIALAAAGALPPAAAIEVINTMGSMMKDELIGGQIIYPIVNDKWQPDPAKREAVMQAIEEINQRPGCALHLSIDLGGNLVLGGDEAGMKAFEAKMPKVDDKFPMRLFNHAAFHTPLLDETSVKAKQQLPESLFKAPVVPLVDGRGRIWQPYSSHLADLHDYTLGHQVNAAYDFSQAIETAVKEFAPDKLVILGPGMTLGGSVAQTLIKLNWQGLSCKADFIERQKTDPLILAMGMAEQRAEVCPDN